MLKRAHVPVLEVTMQLGTTYIARRFCSFSSFSFQFFLFAHSCGDYHFLAHSVLLDFSDLSFREYQAGLSEMTFKVTIRRGNSLTNLNIFVALQLYDLSGLFSSCDW